MELNGRKVVNAEVDDVDTRDYPDFCDAHFSYAEYEDTGEELEEADLELLNNDYPEVVNEMAFEYYM
jgi:hypothetical protein